MPAFSSLNYTVPNLEELQTSYQDHKTSIEKASGNDFVEAVCSFDEKQKWVETQASINYVHYTLNTKDPKIHKDKQAFDQILPEIEEMTIPVIETILQHKDKELLTDSFGNRLLKIYQAKTELFNPKIKKHLVEEAALVDEYTSLLAQASIDYKGATYNLSSLPQFFLSPDRSVRKETQKLYHNFFAKHAETLDTLYSRLVLLRNDKAKQLNYAGYIPYIYQERNRFDYDQKDVATFRQEVEKHLVPLVEELLKEQQNRLELDTFFHYDEPLFDPLGSPKPKGGEKEIKEAAAKMYQELSPETDAFFTMMQKNELFDLVAKPGKAGGGYCISFDAYHLPFIFSNFNGTKADILVMTHECGHAFQYAMSQPCRLSHTLWPPIEAAEIYSMGMEFLTWPWMPHFFGEEAQRFYKEHLHQSIKGIPYMVAVDAFQHQVFEQIEQTPEQRNAFWQQLEKRYLPWRRYDDVPRFASGAAWQTKHHIYDHPFYYIEYALAQLIALQLLDLSKKDPKQAIACYLKGCTFGGKYTFSETVSKMGFINPLLPNGVESIVEKIRPLLVSV